MTESRLLRARGGHLAHAVDVTKYERDPRGAEAACGFAPSGDPCRAMAVRHGWEPGSKCRPCSKCKAKTPSAYEGART